MSDAEQRTAQISAKSAQAQALLETAKNRLTTTQQMLTTAQDNYVKSTDMLLEQKNKLGQIQATLTKLTKENVSLVCPYHTRSWRCQSRDSEGLLTCVY